MHCELLSDRFPLVKQLQQVIPRTLTQCSAGTAHNSCRHWIFKAFKIQISDSVNNKKQYLASTQTFYKSSVYSSWHILLLCYSISYYAITGLRFATHSVAITCVKMFITGLSLLLFHLLQGFLFFEFLLPITLFVLQSENKLLPHQYTRHA